MSWRSWEKAGVEQVSQPVQRLLTADRGLSAQATSALRMIEKFGDYSGRKVSYFRVFDPTAVQAAGVSVKSFTDLDAHYALQLYTGHIESDGQIVLGRQ